MASETLNLRLVSPDQTVFEGDVTGAVVPAWDGSVGFLPGHAPFIALLGAGTLELKLPGGGIERFFVRRGVVKVEGDEITVLSEYAGADTPDDFDPTAAWLDLESEKMQGEEIAHSSVPANPLA